MLNKVCCTAIIGLMMMPLLSGCAGSGSHDTPSAKAITHPSSVNSVANYNVVDITANNLAQNVVPEQVTPVSLTPVTVPDVPILAGDTLRITVYERSDGGTFAPISIGGSVFPSVMVDNNGSITLPYVGSLNVAHSSLASAATMIRNALVHQQLAVGPQVEIEFVTTPGHSVVVAGDVKTPGRVPTIGGKIDVLDAISRSGGPAQISNATDIVVHRADGQSVELPYTQLLLSPLEVTDGDQILALANARRFVAMGAVLKPGQIDMTARRTSLLDALGMAGGLDDMQADRTHVFVFRLTNPDTNPRPTVYRFNMSRGESLFLARMFPIQPNDGIVVSHSGLHDFEKFTTPFLQVLTMMRFMHPI